MLLLLRIHHAAEDVGIQRSHILAGVKPTVEQRWILGAQMRIKFLEHLQIKAADIMTDDLAFVFGQKNYPRLYASVLVPPLNVRAIVEYEPLTCCRTVGYDAMDLADLIQQAIGFYVEE